MSWPRSIAPERDWNPMSYVPPSPPKAMNFHVSSILPRFFMALYAVSTPDIFRRLTHKDHPPIGELPKEGDPSAWIAFLAGQRNDLEAPARALLPEIAEISDMLRNTGARLVRMSGSGATCFGIFNDRASAEAAERQLARLRPEWYFQATETVARTRP